MAIDITVELHAGYIPGYSSDFLMFFSSTGINKSPEDFSYYDTENRFYLPYLADSILIKHDGLNFNTSLSIKLANPGDLDVLRDFIISYSRVVVSASKDGGDYKTLISTQVESYNIGLKSVTIRTKNGYEALQNTNYTNGIFQGVGENISLHDPSYIGDENLYEKGIVQPRVIGKVFNITPTLMVKNTLFYGFNFNGYQIYSYFGIYSWAPQSRQGGQITTISEVRDKGVPLTFYADYAYPYELERADIPHGHYGTCLAYSNIKLGSPPDGQVTLDAEDEDTNTLRKAINAIKAESGAWQESVFYDVPDYIIGAYYTDTIDILSVIKQLIEGFDLLVWRNENDIMSFTTMDYYPEVKINFVDVESQDIKDGDMPILSFDMIKSVNPVLKTDFGFKKNHTVQSITDLAGSVEDTKQFELDYNYSHNFIEYGHLLYEYTDPLVINTALQIVNEDDSYNFRRHFILNRLERSEEFEVTVRLMESDGTKIAGILDAGTTIFTTADSTDFTSDTTSVTADMTSTTLELSSNSIRLGQGASLRSSRFGLDGSQHFAIISYSVNTKKLTATYVLRAVRNAPDFNNPETYDYGWLLWLDDISMFESPRYLERFN